MNLIRFSLFVSLFLHIPLILSADAEGQNFSKKRLHKKGDKVINVLKEEDGYRRTDSGEREDGLALLPEFSGSQVIRSELAAYDPDEFIELYFEMPLPETNGQELSLYLVNQLGAMDTMAGIKYFSGMAQKMVKYIYRCFFVEKTKTYKRLKSPSFPSLPVDGQFILMQDDNRFAPIWYDVRIRADGEAVRISMTNITTVYVQIIFNFKALDPGMMRHEIVLLPQEDHLILYTVSEIHNTVKKVLGRELNLADSFDHRMSGIQGWIAGRLYGE